MSLSGQTGLMKYCKLLHCINTYIPTGTLQTLIFYYYFFFFVIKNTIFINSSESDTIFRCPLLSCAAPDLLICSNIPSRCRTTRRSTRTDRWLRSDWNQLRPNIRCRRSPSWRISPICRRTISSSCGNTRSFSRPRTWSPRRPRRIWRCDKEETVHRIVDSNDIHLWKDYYVFDLINGYSKYGSTFWKSVFVNRTSPSSVILQVLERRRYVQKIRWTDVN